MAGQDSLLRLAIICIALSVCIMSPVRAQGIAPGEVVAMNGPCTTSYQGPCNRSEAHFVLGGLIPLHQLQISTGKASFFIEALQWTEALRHAVHLVNADETLLPGLKLGFAVRDTFSDERQGLGQSLSFLGSRYCRLNDSEVRAPRSGPEAGGIGNGTHSCTTTPNEVTSFVSRVAGVIGPYSSPNAISVTDLFDLFQVPVVSYSATSPHLSDKARFPHFLRTVPSDRLTSRAVAQLARKLNWTFVNIINTDDNFGNAGAEAVAAEFSQRDGSGEGGPRCVGTETVGARRGLSPQPKAEEVNAVWKLLLETSPQNESNVAVLFTQKNGAQELFRVAQDSVWGEAARRRNLTFLGVGAWAHRSSEAVNEGIDLAKGSISVIASGEPVKVFDRHFGSLHPSTTKDNPWLVEGWEHIFNCSLNEPECGKNNLTDPRHYKQDSKVPFVYDAVFAFAHAFHHIYVNDCHDQSCNCASLRNATRAFEALKNVSFTTMAGATFRFDEQGDPVNAQYSIKNIVVNKETKTALFPTVGKYHVEVINESNQTLCENRGLTFTGGLCLKEELTINLSQVVWNSGRKEIPRSRCSDDCQPGNKRKLNDQALSCCWSCLECQGHSYSSTVNSENCLQCPDSESVLYNRTGCKHIAVNEWSASELPFVLPVIGLVVISCVVLIACIVLVVIHRNTSFIPFGLEPTVLCLAGLLLINVSQFTLLGGPSAFACGAQVVIASFGYIAVISPLLVYVFYRLCVVITRPQAGFLFNTRRRLAVSLVFVAIETILLLFCMILAPPEVSSVMIRHTKEDRKCALGAVHYLMLFFFDLLLLICLAIGAYTLREERHSNFVYEVDTRPRVLYFTVIGCLIALFIDAFSFLIQASTSVDPVGETGLIHMFVWLNSSALFLIIFTQQMRQLGPLGLAERKWLESTRQRLLSISDKTRNWRTTSSYFARGHGSLKKELPERRSQESAEPKGNVYVQVQRTCCGMLSTSDPESLTQPAKEYISQEDRIDNTSSAEIDVQLPSPSQTTSSMNGSQSFESSPNVDRLNVSHNSISAMSTDNSLSNDMEARGHSSGQLACRHQQTDV